MEAAVPRLSAPATRQGLHLPQQKGPAGQSSDPHSSHIVSNAGDAPSQLHILVFSKTASCAGGTSWCRRLHAFTRIPTFCTPTCE